MNNLFFFTVKVASVGLFFSCTSFELIGKKRGMLPNTCASHGSNIDINPTVPEAEKNNKVVTRSKGLFWGRTTPAIGRNSTKQELEVIIKNIRRYVNITKEEITELMCRLIARSYPDLVKLLLETKEDIDLHASSSGSGMHTFGGPVNILGIAIDKGELEIFKMLVSKDPSLLSSIAVGHASISGNEGGTAVERVVLLSRIAVGYAISGDEECTAVERIILNERDEMLHWVLSEEKLRNSIPYAHLEKGFKRSLDVIRGRFNLTIPKILIEEGEMPLPGNVLEMVHGYSCEGAHNMLYYLGGLILDNRRQCDEIKPLLNKIIPAYLASLITSYLLFSNVRIPKKVCRFLEGKEISLVERSRRTSLTEDNEGYVGYEALQAALDKYKN